ncbi:SH3 domain-containing protein [Leptospira alstonii]|uniref:SH3 domain protein n=2 Tax=Leptospira alstonii TaxID=28452 RepID=M6D8U1_9LEPT|nr:SH3 domain-containing protein [Leptospira alstonii]EMJ94955.1 SH3 domain protein [Leptospira alstonii serovar Sichuan str. 79601]EQA78913.1 SH3 domain protein [Leptospira alstonii serovar Pingchang str. 80-412]
MKKIPIFSRIRNFGTICLILLGFISGFLQAEEKQNIRYVLIWEGKLNVREKPINGKVIFQLEKGESVTVKEGTENSEWPEITAKSGAQGFVSSEFLSKTRPEDLENAKLFGSISSHTEGSWFRSLAIRIQNQWLSANDHSAETYSLEKKMIQTQGKIAAYEGTDIAGEFSPEKKEITGCQEVRVVKGSLFAFKKINTLRNSVFAIFGSKIGDKVRSDRYVPSEKISQLLDASANSIFKKKHPRQEELKFLKRGDLYTIKTPEKNYLFVRYAIRVEPEEKSYYAAIYEFNNGELGKNIFEKFDVLMNEQAVYGGKYHFLGAFDLDENGVPILILHHNGYDGYINEFAKIKNGRLQSMFLTGGDAC